MLPPDSDLEARFRQWAADYQPLLYKVARSFAATAQDRQELLQDILVQLWHSMPRFNGHCAASTWVYRVAFNTAMAWHRSSRRRTARQETDIDWEAMIAPEAAPPPRVEELYAAIRQLSKPEAALIMMHLDGLSYREMAEVMGLSEINIGTKLTRLRARLGQLLMKGYPDER